ncbi:hypothetical protein M3689_01820 [Alkalihalophilus marmarensis]|uniref:Uncharacterized protein n=1 Tax=Alkalihalophilus marmarensis DSM 21297 TaxID=1188261 RepID=U6SMX0_9BACI|nr:hypothetical protein [Alkalihalophilus marmarensis]ERN52737.1 hypothetical protein A33I_15015 [Alkalihalophilus marmarensis DSM 21297]MCM3488039.1 hypothetical protein [Alkalihalophilus marmarensis]
MRRQSLLVNYFLMLLIVIAGCESNKEEDLSFEATVENSHLKVELVDIEPAVQDNQTGFFVDVLVTSLHPSYDVRTDFNYAMDKVIATSLDKKHEAAAIYTYDSTASATSLEPDQILIRQFYTPGLEETAHVLHVPFYAKPLYHKRNITFKELSHQSNHIEHNDFKIISLDVEQHTLSLIASDVHEMKGLEVTLLIDDETIYPAFQTTNVEETTNLLHGTYEFTQPISEPFTLKLQRPRLDDLIWTFDLSTPIPSP